MGIKKILNLESQHLSKSILLEESGAAMITKGIIGFSVVVFAVFLGWSFITTVDEVAIAKGEVLPEGRVRNIQHISGGIIHTILVEEGQLVAEGQALIVLDNPEVRANIKQLKAKQHYLQASQERLRTYLESIGALKKRAPIVSEPSSDVVISIQDQQFDQDQKEILKLLLVYHKIRRAAFQNQVGQYKSKMEEMGENTDTLKELAQLNEKLVLVNSELSLAKEKLASLTLRSPINGVVHGLQANGMGGVVGSGTILMEVVPQDSRLYAQIQVSAKDIGHIKEGQPVHLKFTTYDFARYGALVGRLSEISATTFMDRAGVPYYKATVKLQQKYLDEQRHIHPILPGMTVEANIITGEKTIFEYLLKPVFTSSHKALRER